MLDLTVGDAYSKYNCEKFKPQDNETLIISELKH